jgi:hypothetical protein
VCWHLALNIQACCIWHKYSAKLRYQIGLGEKAVVTVTSTSQLHRTPTHSHACNWTGWSSIKCNVTWNNTVSTINYIFS